MHKIHIIGIGSELGTKKKSIEEIAEVFGVTVDEMKATRGTSELRFLEGDFTDAAIKAADKIENLDLSKVRGIFGSSNPTAEYLIPSSTVVIANKLGLMNIIADQIGIGCAGGMQALRAAYNQAVVDAMNGKFGQYLVVVGDNTYNILNSKQYTTSGLFSEGVIILVISNEPDCNEGYLIERIAGKCLLGPDIKGITLANPHHPASKGIITKLQMNGRGIFKFGATILGDALELLGLESFPEHCYLVPHQPNLRMLEAMKKKFGLATEQVYTRGIRKIGNTSGAAVFFGLEDALKRKLYEKIKWVDFAGPPHRRFRENHLVPALQEVIYKLFINSEHPLQEVKKISDYCLSKESKPPYFSLEQAFDLALLYYMTRKGHPHMADEICKIVMDTAEPIKKWSSLLHGIIFNEIYFPPNVYLMYKRIISQIDQANVSIEAKTEMTDRAKFFFQREGD